MQNPLIDKGIILQSGEINKNKINLVAGAITQPFAKRLCYLRCICIAKRLRYLLSALTSIGIGLPSAGLLATW